MHFCGCLLRLLLKTAELKTVAKGVTMKQSDVKLGAMYRVLPGLASHYSLCKVRQYGKVWVKVVAGRDTRRYGNLDIIKRYNPHQVVITIEKEPKKYDQVKVLIEDEILTMNGRSWRSIVEVNQ